MKLSLGDRVYNTVCYIVISILSLLVLYPVIYVISSSFSSPDAIQAGRVWLWPVDATVRGYQAVFANKDVWIGYRNTIMYTVVGTILSVATTMMAAYPLARKGLRGGSTIMFYFTVTMLFGGGLIPTYINIRNLGLMNSPWVLILPAMMNVYNMIVARTFIQSNIPSEMLEAAKIDGCSDFAFFFKMVLPLSKAIIAVLSLWCAVYFWNSYFDAFLYLQDSKYYPLQIILRDILVQSQMNAAMIQEMAQSGTISNYNLYLTLKYALIVVATVPMFCFYPFVQKHFVKGIMVGSVKG